jgi:hypothetical protein
MQMPMQMSVKTNRMRTSMRLVRIRVRRRTAALKNGSAGSMTTED